MGLIVGVNFESVSAILNTPLANTDIASQLHVDISPLERGGL